MKTFSTITLCLSLATLISCTKDYVLKSDNDTSSVLLSEAQINKVLRNKLDENGSFNWMDVDEQVLWSAVVHGQNILTVGYGQNYINTLKSTNDITRTEILSLVNEIENSNTNKLKNTKEIIIDEDEGVSIIDLKVTKIETIRALRQAEHIRYLEPGAYNYIQGKQMLKQTTSGGGGGGCNTTAHSINSADYSQMHPNCQIPWNYLRHNIPQAWQFSKGKGVTVGLIDTGVSSEQAGLGKSFSTEFSPDRTIKKHGVFVDSFWPWATKTDGPDDKCGHGTLMAGSIAAPINDINMPIGVANQCNLIAYRATQDVLLDGYHEQKGVAKAITQLAKQPEVKIISMSLGHMLDIGRIEDAVKFAHKKGKLLIAAGGTSTEYTNWSGVIFPARMKEVVAVTGIKDSGYIECNLCHKGKKIDFTTVMQRGNDDERLAVTLGFYNGDRSYSHGSSVATAMLSGIAALVWAKYPNWTSQQILEKLKKSAEFYPNRHSEFGFGNIDALKAVQ